MSEPLTQQGRRGGFTLIELSIVLVIIGLIVGGIVAGRALIEASELKKIHSDVVNLQTKVHTFRTKFNAVPGDMARAENIWGSDSACPNTVANNDRKIATCNGNGDGKLMEHAPGISAVQVYEMYRFFQHLSNAELLPERYTGVVSTNPNTIWGMVAGLNGPAIGKANLIIYPQTLITSATHVFEAGLGNVFSLSDMNLGYAINGTQAYSMDLKYDDGMPATGTITTGRSSPCISSTAITATWLASTTTNICAPAFGKAF